MAKKPTPIADPTLPKVSVEVAGKKYHLCFDFNALATAESMTGLNLLRGLSFSNTDARTLRALLFAALLKCQPEMTLEDAGNLFANRAAHGAITKAIVDAYMESNPEAEEDAPKNAE